MIKNSNLTPKKYLKMKSDYHKSVFLKEIIENLNIKEDGIYIDATLGRAGHSKEILKRIKNGKLYCFDVDIEAIEYSKEKLSEISNKFEIINSNFKNIKEEMNQRNINHVDGIIFDLGVSSPQFDEDYRGFSYRFDSKLDMRMDLNNPLDAKKIINTYSLKDLINIFKNYGEEKYSYSIAKNIIKKREEKEINSTFELVDIIKESIPKKELFKDKHPAKKVFQALRIEVNDELNSLKIALNSSLSLLNKGAILEVTSFHSLEDRIVKTTFKEVTTIKGNRINDFKKNNDKKVEFELVSKKVILPSEEEIKDNNRSKSAKLRIIKKI